MQKTARLQFFRKPPAASPRMTSGEPHPFFPPLRLLPPPPPSSSTSTNGRAEARGGAPARGGRQPGAEEPWPHGPTSGVRGFGDGEEATGPGRRARFGSAVAGRSATLQVHLWRRRPPSPPPSLCCVVEAQPPHAFMCHPLSAGEEQEGKSSRLWKWLACAKERIQ